MGKEIRSDGWANIITSVGVLGRDKRLGAQIDYRPLSAGEAESLYAGDDVAEKMVDELPGDGTREWIELVMEAELASKTEKILEKLRLKEMCKQAWSWARLYGGAAILISVDDSRLLREPLDPKRVRRVTGLSVFNRYELYPDSICADESNPNYGKPETYRFHPLEGYPTEFNEVIHHSRLLRFYGAKMPRQLRSMTDYWGDSILTKRKNAILNYNISFDAATVVLQEFNQAVIKMKGLADAVRAGQEEVVIKRLQIMNLSKSICRAIVLDEDEDYENLGAAIQGVPDMLEQVSNRLVVSSNMPRTKLLGDSPKGLNATGNSEKTDWYDYVAAQQREVLLEPLMYFLELLFQSRQGPNGGRIPENWSLKFKKLWQMDDKELAECRKIEAETDQIRIHSGVLDSDQVAEGRFGGGRYSPELKVTLTSWQDNQETEDDTGLNRDRDDE